MNRSAFAKWEHAQRTSAPEDASDRGVSLVTESPAHGFAVAGGDTPLRELARYATGSLDLLYCGGILHRMPRAEGGRLVAACFRVLKPLGSIRVATVDVDRIVQGYLFDWIDENDKGASRTQKLNAAFRQGGVQFIYGEEELTALLVQAGFADIRRFAAGASPNQKFWNLESDHACALILEAIKP